MEWFMPTHIVWSQTETETNNQPTDLCDSLPVIDINKPFNKEFDGWVFTGVVLWFFPHYFISSVD